MWEKKFIFEFTNPVVSQLVFDRTDQVKSFRVTDKTGTELAFSKTKIQDKLMIEIETSGDFNVEVQL